MRKVKLVRFEDGNGREWWQIAVRGPWWWPVWRYVRRALVSLYGVHYEPAEWTTRDEAEEAMREVRDRLRRASIRKMEEIRS